MVKFYVTQIKMKRITLEQVPIRWRSQVEEALREFE